jgi:acyl-coenzyme A synthetase/AMP-(fatty) acid ligase
MRNETSKSARERIVTRRDDGRGVDPRYAAWLKRGAGVPSSRERFMDVPSLNESKSKIVQTTKGLQDVYAHVGEYFASRVLFTTDEPIAFSGYENELTGLQMRDLGYKIAHALATGKVVRKPNARVIIAKRNHGDYFFYTHSLMYAGGVPVVVNSRTGWTYIGGMQRLSKAEAILTDADTLLRNADDAELRKLMTGGVRFWLVDRDIERVRAAFPASAPIFHLWPLIEHAPATPIPLRDYADDSPIAMFHTSGTTGVPKLCVYDARTTRESWKPAAAFSLTEKSRRMTGLPCAHAVFFIAQTGAFLGGAWTYLPSRFDPKAWLSAMERYEITYYLGFPYTYMRMAAEDHSQYKLESMQGWMSGGDTAHAAHIDKFKKFGANELTLGPVHIQNGSFFINPYGSTEIGGGAVYHFSVPGQKAIPCRCGKATSGIGGDWKMKIVDKNWKDVPRGQVGRIVLRGEYTPRGYWNDDERWFDNRVDGWTWIGDVGRIDEEGFLYILDREVDVIETALGTVYSLEAEEHILAHEEVMEAAVVKRTLASDESLGEAIALIVPNGHLEHQEPRRDWSRLEADVKAFANARIAAKITEVRVVALDQLPLGVTGKVLKRKLREALDAEAGLGAGAP